MNDYSVHLGTKKEGTSKTNYFKYIKVITVLAIFSATIIFLTLFKSSFSKEANLTPPTSNTSNTPAKNSDNRKLTFEELTSSIEKEVSSGSGTYSIYFYGINSKKEYGLRENTVFMAASVNKIPILAALYHLAGKGEINLDKIITPQRADIQDYGSGTIRYDSPGTPYSIKTLGRLMMEKSDNTAAYILASQIIGLKKIRNLVESWGLTQTDMTENETSVHDMALLLIKMYKGEITKPSLTAEMLGFMEKSDYDDRLPAGLPNNIKIYHKTGDEVGKLHDAGIINLPNKPYYLGIFTMDIIDEKAAKQIMAEISRLVFEYMEKS